MKFDPLLKYENNKLSCIASEENISTENVFVCNIDDFINSNGECVKSQNVPVVVGVKVPVKTVELSDGNYNEDILAKFRDVLKSFENSNLFFFVIPVIEQKFSNAEEADSVISAMKHTARRIKDCESVVGFEIPVEFLSQDAGKVLDENSWTMWFVSEMSAKHKHYLYFVSEIVVKETDSYANVSEKDFVLYKM